MRQEAIQNVKRLRNHPCLVLWCGNNEIDSEWSHDVSGGWEEQFDEKTGTKIWHDYEKLFHEVIPGIVKKYDPYRFYWHSSPLADFNERSFYESKSGDIHYWGVWHGKEPFENFQHNVGRFMSEYGFQSFPEFKTVKAFTIPEDWRINSEVMKAHKRSGSGNSLIKSYMDMYYREPKDFKSLLYVGQVLQAEAVKMAVEAHRRKMPYCMGSLYWQLNDCWPVSSWSSIDYFGRWKAVHYFAKKAFNNILISPTINDDKLKVFIVSDLLKPLSAKMIIEVMDFSGKKMWQKTIPVEVKANTSHCYFTENVKKIINGLDKNKIFLRTIVMNNDQPLSQNIFYFLSIKNLNLPAPKIEKTITAKKNGFRIRLSSLELAKNIYLSIDDTKGFFTDNYFDLLPGEVVEVDFSNKGDAEYFKENLKIVSLRNSYQ